MRRPDQYDVKIADFAEGESVIYEINWLRWLNGAAIATSQVDPLTDGTLTIDDAGVLDTATQQRFRVSGGTAGQVYQGVATIVTDSGVTLKTSIRISVTEP